MPTTEESPGKGQVAARTGLGAELWQAIASPRFTLLLLIALVFLCLLGAVLPQSEGSSFTKPEFYDPELLYYLQLAGLTHIFHSGWFILVLALLILNQSCALMDLLADTWNFESGRAQLAAEISTQVSREHFRELLRTWSQGRLSSLRAVRDDGEKGELLLAAQEGKWSRLFPLFSRLGFLVLVVGGIVENLRGFEGQVTLEEGARVNYVQALRGKVPGWTELKEKGKPLEGFYEPGFELELLRFKPEFYPGTQVARQQTSWIKFVQGGLNVGAREVSVHSPTSFLGLRFFQGEFAATAQTKMNLLIREESEGLNRLYQGLFRGQKYELEGTSFAIEDVQSVEGMGLGMELQYVAEGNSPERFWIFQNFPEYDSAHRKKSRHHFSIPSGIFMEPRYSSTIKVSRNPGLFWVASGAWIFALALLGGALFSFNRYGFAWSEGKVRILGRSSRMSLFSEDFTRLVESLKQALDSLEVRDGSV